MPWAWELVEGMLESWWGGDFLRRSYGGWWQGVGGVLPAGTPVRLEAAAAAAATALGFGTGGQGGSHGSAEIKN